MVIGEAFYDPPTEMQDKEFMGNVSAAYAFGAHAVEVEVDQQTGRVKILDYVAAHDLGRAINPLAVEGQIDGGVTMGLGYALSEEMLVREGKILNPTFLDYRVPTACDSIRIKKILVETNDPAGPYGAKGIGEPCLIPVAAAVANAISNAIGVRIRSLPITPEKILSALKEKTK
jgi:xanthine dehydrogenase molybdenum-binding subunit